MSSSGQKWLLCRIGTRCCAVPLGFVAETMRPPAVAQLDNADAPGIGLAIVRGEPVPVVDAAALFGEPQRRPARLVKIGVGDRWVALAVDDVLGVETIADDLAAELPPLLRGAAADAVSAIGIRDGEFLLCLDASRLIPDAASEAGSPTGCLS